MPTDENTRFRIRQYFVEQIDEQAADAIMESMAPVPWTELATKTDVARLETRIDGIDQRLHEIDQRFDGIDQRLHEIDQRFDGIGQRLHEIDRRLERVDNGFEALDARIGLIGERFDGLREGLADQFVGLEGRLAMRFTEAVRLIVFALMVLMTGVIATGIAFAGLA